MKYLICSFILLSEVSFAKIQLEPSLAHKTPSRKNSQFDLRIKAQELLSSFINCSAKVDTKDSPIDSDAATCVKNHFVNEPSTVSIVKYFAWLQSDTKVSNLYKCEGELLELAETFKDQPKDLFYCVTTKDGPETQEGIISFRVKDEQLKILKIKLM